MTKCHHKCRETSIDQTHHSVCQVGWGCRIHQLILCRRVIPLNKCPGYDSKQSDGEIPVMLELWGMGSTPSLPLLSGPLWSEVVVPNRILSMGQVELNSSYAKLNCLKWNYFWNWNCTYIKLLFEVNLIWHLTACKKYYTYPKLNCLK